MSGFEHLFVITGVETPEGTDELLRSKLSISVEISFAIKLKEEKIQQICHTVSAKLLLNRMFFMSSQQIAEVQILA